MEQRESILSCISLPGLSQQKYLRLCGLNNEHLFSHNFETQKSKIKVSTGLVSPGASLLRLQMAVFSLSSHGPSSMHAHP